MPQSHGDTNTSAVKPNRRVSFSEHAAAPTAVPTQAKEFKRAGFVVVGSSQQHLQQQPSSSQRKLRMNNPLAASLSTGLGGGGGAVASTNNNTNHTVVTSRRANQRRRWYRHILRSRMWTFALVICTIILCVAAPIRDIILFPSYVDIIFNVIFCICFVIFTFDIWMRIETEPNYFDFFGFRNNYKRNNSSADGSSSDYYNTDPTAAQQQQTSNTSSRGLMQNHQRPHHATGGGGGGGSGQNSNDSNLSDDRGGSNSSTNGSFNWGSFLFWCDFASTLTLLYDISWTNPRYFAEPEFSIFLNEYGFPPNGLGVNTGLIVSVGNAAVFVAIGKSARMARFIRSHTVVHLTSNINWHLLWTICIKPSTIASFCRRCWKVGPIRAIKDAYLERKEDGISNDSAAATGTITPRRLRSVVGGGSTDDLTLSLRLENDASYTKSTMATAGTSRNAIRADDSDDDEHNHKKKRNESQVGVVMRELTSQRIALGIIVALFITALFTYVEYDATRPSTMVVLHIQTTGAPDPSYINKALDAARASSTPGLFSYQLSNGTNLYYLDTSSEQPTPKDLRPRELMQVSVRDVFNYTTIGRFENRLQSKQEALVLLLYTAFILVVWVIGVTLFAGPVMVLVVVPIERMVKLLSMLMIDPLGYQRTRRYKRFVLEEEDVIQNTQWSRESLKGMETSFLMSTILRIGSLMQVGFGSAGVEIIRQNLSKSKSKSMDLLTNAEGTIVPCIFLFCDIRNFTDATESLQEEVFVFTNSIAAVVHSHCASLGGSANKNIGDAFLCSWLLDKDDGESDEEDDFDGTSGEYEASSKASGKRGTETFKAKFNQADKCMLAVVRICMALRHDDYYLDKLSFGARDALITKLQNRPGSVVQIGFGLHAGKAVQGAIGSQRKIDATYLSEAVERSEFLESSTKKYGVKMLMSDSFHRLLDLRNQRRCRKVDQIVIRDNHDGDDDDGDYDDDDVRGKIMDLLTYDMDIDALGNDPIGADTESDMNSETMNNYEHRRTAMMLGAKTKRSRISLLGLPTNHRGEHGASATSAGGGVGTLSVVDDTSDNQMDGPGGGAPTNNPNTAMYQNYNSNNNNNNIGAGGGGMMMTSSVTQQMLSMSGGGGGNPGDYLNDDNDPTAKRLLQLVMPPPQSVANNSSNPRSSSTSYYNASVWSTEEMRIIRQRYSDGIFFQKFNAGLQSFYGKDWDDAKQCFTTILSRFEDGPSRYFLNQIEQHHGKPPSDFLPYGLA